MKSVLSAKTGFVSQLWHNFCGGLRPESACRPARLWPVAKKRKAVQLTASALIPSQLRPSPDLLQILESLEIVFLFQPACDPEFRQDCHHLPEGNTRSSRPGSQLLLASIRRHMRPIQKDVLTTSPRSTQQGLKKAQDYYEQPIRKDSSFARAYVAAKFIDKMDLANELVPTLLQLAPSSKSS